MPTLVIHSLGDQRIPVDVGRNIAAAIPNAEFVGLESDGHLLLGREAASPGFCDNRQRIHRPTLRTRLPPGPPKEPSNVCTHP